MDTNWIKVRWIYISCMISQSILKVVNVPINPLVLFWWPYLWADYVQIDTIYTTRKSWNINGNLEMEKGKKFISNFIAKRDAKFDEWFYFFSLWFSS